MKHIYLIALLLVTAFGFSQPEKDKLLVQDGKEVTSQLQLMNYLDSIAISYTVMDRAKQAALAPGFYRYYTDSIVKFSPVANVSGYLGYEGYSAPMTWQQFRDRAAAKNLDALVSLTQKYGYISTRRLKGLGLPVKFAAINFVARGDSHDKVLKKLFREEYKIGAIEQTEYNLFLFMIERKKSLDAREIKQLEKKGKKFTNVKVQK